MKCFLGHIGRWNHDITGGTPIKILSLKIHLCSTYWFDMGDSEKAVYLSFLYENTKKMLENEESGHLSLESLECSFLYSYFWGTSECTAKWSKLTRSIECALVPFECPHEIMWLNVSVFFGKDVLVKLTVVPRRDQLDVSSSLINAPIRISLDLTNMHAHIFLAYHFFF